jgi:hypothetical protein
MRTLSLLALALLTSFVAAASAAGAATTLAHEDSRILALAHDAGRVAWLTDRCTTIRIQSIPTGQRGTMRPHLARRHRCNDSRRERMALAGRRMLVTGFLGGGNVLDTEIRTGSLTFGRMETLDVAFDNQNSELGEFTSLAGDGDTLLYAWVVMVRTNEECALDPTIPCVWQAQLGNVRLVVGLRQRQLPLPRAAALAVSQGRVALAPVNSGEQENDPMARAVEDGPVEIRNARSGGLIASFSPAGTVERLAFSGSRVASLAKLAGGGRRLEVHSASTGVLELSRDVSVLARELDMAGSRVVFRVGKAIHLLNVGTGTVQTIARIHGRTIPSLSIEDHRVVWAENQSGEGSVRSVVLP